MPVGSAARLLEERDSVDRHASLDSLDHVVHRQRGGGAGGHRLHLDTRARGRRGLPANRDDAAMISPEILNDERAGGLPSG